jgi:hypothetical protein
MYILISQLNVLYVNGIGRTYTYKKPNEKIILIEKLELLNDYQCHKKEKKSLLPVELHHF